MSYSMDYPVAAAPANVRAAFIRRTYGHLAGAILAFIAIETLLLNTFGPQVEPLIREMAGSKGLWLVILLGFMGVSYLANYWASSDQSPGLQYAGLGLYVVAEAVLFLPLLYIAKHFYPDAIFTAGVLTFMVFGGLTLAVFFTRRDFSFLAPILTVGSLLALGAIIVGIVAGFNLGLFFCFAMVALASGYIIYYTSNIMLHYGTHQHVAAALALFASVMLLFWYILQIVMSRGRD
jgi:hypothetical protein